MSKNVLITGVVGNLGSAVAKHLIEKNFIVWGIVEPGQKYAALTGVNYFEANLSNEADTEAIIHTIQSKAGQLDAAILTVGGFDMSNIHSTTGKQMNTMFTLNFLTAFHCIKPIYAGMKQKNGGQIVVIGARPAIEGGASEMIPYVISKGALIQLAGILNENSAKDKIITSVIVPSIIDTAANRSAMPDADFSKWVTPQVIAENIGHLLSPGGQALRSPILKLYNEA